MHVPTTIQSQRSGGALLVVEAWTPCLLNPSQLWIGSLWNRDTVTSSRACVE